MDAKTDVKTSPATFIRICGLSKRYQFRRVFTGLDLDLARGEWVVICGPNGVGKSTLLRLIAGLERADSGSITTALPAADKASPAQSLKIGYLSHASGLYEELSPRENLAFFAEVYRLEHAQERIAQLLAQFGLLDRQDDPVRTLSRGMLRRLSIALAMLNNPDLLLLDEPFAGLDYTSQLSLLHLLKEIQAGGCTILLTTHEFSLEEALDFRLIYLSHGEIAHDSRYHSLAAAKSFYQGQNSSMKKPSADKASATKSKPTLDQQPPQFASAAKANYSLKDYAAQVWAVAKKDLRTEMRTRELFSFMLLFALTAMLIFSFAFGLMAAQARDFVPGVMWTTLAFTSFLGLSKSINRDFAHASMDILRIAPIEPSAIYLGKLIGILVVQAVIAAIILLTALLLFNLNLLQPAMALALATGILGLAAAGTLLATLVERTRARELLLPVLLMPVLIPLLIACVRVTQDAAYGLGLVASLTWYRLIFVYNTLMIAIGMLTYQFTIED